MQRVVQRVLPTALLTGRMQASCLKILVPGWDMTLLCNMFWDAALIQLIDFLCSFVQRSHLYALQHFNCLKIPCSTTKYHTSISNGHNVASVCLCLEIPQSKSETPYVCRKLLKLQAIFYCGFKIGSIIQESYNMNAAVLLLVLWSSIDCLEPQCVAVDLHWSYHTSLLEQDVTCCACTFLLNTML